MINHFSKDMPRPLVGIGHSIGGGQLYAHDPYPYLEGLSDWHLKELIFPLCIRVFYLQLSSSIRP